MKNAANESFIRYAQCENELLKRVKELKRSLAVLESIKEEIRQESDRLDQLKNQATDLHKQQFNLELEKKTKQEREKELRRKLDTVSSPKEYTGYVHELEDISTKLPQLENSILELMIVQEDAEKRYQDEREAAEPWFEEYAAKVKDAELLHAQIAGQIQELEVQCSERKSMVPEDLLQSYAIMKESMSDPVVPVVNNHCGGCQCYINQQDLVRLRAHALVQCKECYRTLYMV